MAVLHRLSRVAAEHEARDDGDVPELPAGQLCPVDGCFQIVHEVGRAEQVAVEGLRDGNRLVAQQLEPVVVVGHRERHRLEQAHPVGHQGGHPFVHHSPLHREDEQVMPLPAFHHLHQDLTGDGQMAALGLQLRNLLCSLEGVEGAADEHLRLE